MIDRFVLAAIDRLEAYEEGVAARTVCPYQDRDRFGQPGDDIAWPMAYRARNPLPWRALVPPAEPICWSAMDVISPTLRLGLAHLNELDNLLGSYN